MFKKHPCLCALLIATVFLAMSCNADIYVPVENPDVHSIFFTVDEEGAASLKEGVTVPSSLIIPHTVENTAVVAVGDCSACAVKSLRIPSSVRTVGFGAFELCTELESVVIDPSVRLVEMCAFTGCTALSKVIINSSDLKLQSGAFDPDTEAVFVYLGVSYSYEELTGLEELWP